MDMINRMIIRQMISEAEAQVRQIRERVLRQRRETEKAQLLASTSAEESYETLVIELPNDIDFLLSLYDDYATCRQVQKRGEHSSVTCPCIVAMERQP